MSLYNRDETGDFYNKYTSVDVVRGQETGRFLRQEVKKKFRTKNPYQFKGIEETQVKTKKKKSGIVMNDRNGE